MFKRHVITLESGANYEVGADYELHLKHGAIGCSVVIHSVRPIDRLDTALTDQLMTEIESAFAYKVIDEYNDGDTEEEFEGYPC